MAQPSPHEQLSIQEIPNILKVARQKAALGLYKESIQSYRHALKVVVQHVQTVSDPFIRDQWKKADDEIKAEVQGAYKLYKSLKVFRGEPGSISSLDSKGQESYPADIVSAPVEHPVERHASQPRDPYKPPPSVMDHFGGLPFVRQASNPNPDSQQQYQSAQGPEFVLKEPKRYSPPEPKKDPLVWDPPSPKPQHQAVPARKPVTQKKLPKWAQNGPKQPPKRGRAQPQQQQPQKPEAADGGRNYPKPWRPAEPPKGKAAAAEEVKGPNGDEYASNCNNTRIEREHFSNIATRTGTGRTQT